MSHATVAVVCGTLALDSLLSFHRPTLAVPRLQIERTEFIHADSPTSGRPARKPGEFGGISAKTRGPSTPSRSSCDASESRIATADAQPFQGDLGHDLLAHQILPQLTDDHRFIPIRLSVEESPPRQSALRCRLGTPRRVADLPIRIPLDGRDSTPVETMNDLSRPLGRAPYTLGNVPVANTSRREQNNPCAELFT